MPPNDIASFALMQRFNIAFSSCRRSVAAMHSCSEAKHTRSMSSPRMRLKNSCISTIISDTSTLLVWRDCSREKLKSLLFSSAPLCAAAVILAISSDSFFEACRFLSRNCRLPRITVKRLLKSCATPPVSRPIASIFCDCSSMFSISFSFERSVKLTTAPILLLSLTTGSAE